MYDNDFNMEGFGAAPALPYGEHGMNRSDTNAPEAFTGNVTVADPYPTQITPDIVTGRGSATSTYGNGAMHRAMDRRGMSYGAEESQVSTFRDSTGRIYGYDKTIRAFITPGGKYVMPTDAAYPALAALYRQQTGSIVGSGTTSGWAATWQGALGNLAQGVGDIPKAFAASQAYASEAQKLAQQQAALQQQGAGTQAPVPQVTAGGMPTWLWVVIAGGVGLVLWSVASGSKKAQE